MRLADFGAGLWPVIWTLIGRAPADTGEDAPRPTNWRRLAAITILAGLCLILIAVAQGLGRTGSPRAGSIFWPALLAMVSIYAFAAVRSGISRMERLVSVILLGQSLHLLKVIYSPTGFGDFDEFLHFRTALDILELHALFANNSLLPVSPLYPGLELVTAPIVSLTGLDIFPVAILIVALTRFVSVGAFFVLFETLSGSSRLAAIGVLVVMSSSGFVSFHGIYGYETLAFPFFLLIIGCTLRLEAEVESRRVQLATLALLLLPAVSVTHHLTSYLTAAIVAGAALLVLVRPASNQPRGLTLLVAAVAIAIPPIWKLLISAPAGEYIGPHVLTALLDLKGLLEGVQSSRQLFVSVDGVQTPLLLRVMGIMSVLVIGVGLLFGFFRALTFRPLHYREEVGPFWLWPSSGAVLLALLGAAFPVTVIFKFTSTGWEVGDRLGTFAMIGAAFICALSFTHFWRQLLPERVGNVGLAAVLSLTIVGGTLNGWGAAVRSGYRVSADALSVEPLGLAVAQWSREVLGQGNRFVADRTNAILTSTYGRQTVLSSLNGDPSIADLYFSNKFGYNDRNIIAAGFVDYILVDRRLPLAAPKVGHYYEPDDLSQHNNVPPQQRDLTKFDRNSEIGRIFDAGAIIVYDVRNIRK